ncbi:HIT domain-containing protein [Candidatus Bathyarchaeota archaeon]|nr:HIT domain-containing protein [Candidatus Bathyarchaeota archaeon]MBS7612699.1 HIT domain-containing protein [Candidatus Bathyarchaeota archaeon]MBS7618207.1 HIT domain-containing protein [Candidatus Bathyarchaeota archaeon]
MKILWAPWRASYVEKPGENCIFCEKIRENRDGENLIVLRGQRGFIMLNRYPYNTGHLMIAPYRHVADMEDLAEDEAMEIFKLLMESIKALKKTFKPDGFNIGVNLGRVAGAGVEGHVHFHVVPRWLGDTNFMPVTANTKVMPISLEEVYERVRRSIKLC